MENYNITYEEVYDWICQSCTHISEDSIECLKQGLEKEKNPAAQAMLKTMLENLEMADSEGKPVCQSPGYPTVYINYSSIEVLAALQEYIPKAIVAATNDGYLRPSIVNPLTRHNPGDNSGEGVPNFECN